MQQRRGELVNRPFIHSFNIQALTAGYNSGSVLGAGETKINKPIPSKSFLVWGSQRIKQECDVEGALRAEDYKSIDLKGSPEAKSEGVCSERVGCPSKEHSKYCSGALSPRRTEAFIKIWKSFHKESSLKTDALDEKEQSARDKGKDWHGN